MVTLDAKSTKICTVVAQVDEGQGLAVSNWLGLYALEIWCRHAKCIVLYYTQRQSRDNNQPGINKNPYSSRFEIPYVCNGHIEK